MRSLIGVSLLALIGCGSEDADGVFVTASWTIRSVAANTALGCAALFPEGAPTVLLSARRTDGGRCNRALTECVTDFEACDVLPPEGESRKATGTGTSMPLVPGIYEVQLSIVSEDGAQMYAALPETIDLTLGDQTYARQFFTDGGVFQFGWTLRDAQNAPRTCEQAGAFGIVISVQDEMGGASAANDRVDCEDRATGYSFALPNGNYTVTLEAVNEADGSLGDSGTLSGQMIMGPNGITDLGTVDVFLSDP